MTSEKHERVITAATTLFLRYGFRRVTMGDIAKEAKISRPALYLVFRCKEEIFRQVLVHFRKETLAEVRRGIADLPTTAEKLEFAFEIWTVRPFVLVSQLPDARELLACRLGFAQDLCTESSASFEEVLRSILSGGETVPANEPQKTLSVAELAHLLAVAARGFREEAKDADELRHLVAGLVKMTLATVERHKH